MTWTLPIRVGIVGLVAIIAAPSLADEDAVRKSFATYLKAFGEADTAAMDSHYAKEVIVIAQSTLLEKKYGALGGDDGKTKDQKVTKDKLLKAYDKAIEAFGGKKDWVDRHQKLKEQRVETVTVTAEQLKSGEIKLAGVKPGDVMAFVLPEGDVMTFIYRKNDKGTWTIIAEHWD